MIYDVLDVCRHIINYSEKEDYGVSNLKLQKLLYFVQAYFMLEKKDHAPKNFTPQYEYWLSLTNLGKQFVEWVEEETRQ